MNVQRGNLQGAARLGYFYGCVISACVLFFSSLNSFQVDFLGDGYGDLCEETETNLGSGVLRGNDKCR